MALEQFKLTKNAPSSYKGVIGSVGYVDMGIISSDSIDDVTAKAMFDAGLDWVEEVSKPKIKNETFKEVDPGNTATDLDNKSQPKN